MTSHAISLAKAAKLESSEAETGDDRLRWIDDELALLELRGLRRRLGTRDGPQQVRLHVGGRELVNFGSNDYLALAADARVRSAAMQAAQDEGWGAGASPLVTGHGAAHRRLEERLAEFEGTEAALVFPSGYAANQGTIAALVGREDAVYSDEKNHASMVDGCRLSRARVHVYRHRDAQALESLLSEGGQFRRRLIVTESLFSMDGDVAPLVELVELARRFDCMLLVDEAHASGVWGPGGRGLAEHLAVEDGVDIRVGTLSKALGGAGGFVCGSQRLIDWLVNRARSYVFSTALPPANCAAALAALEIVSTEPWRRAVVHHHAGMLRSVLREQGWNLGASESQIIPLVVGDAGVAMRLAGRLLDEGLVLPGIRPPSVPSGGALLRVSLTSGHDVEMIDRLVDALARVASDYRHG